MVVVMMIMRLMDMRTRHRRSRAARSVRTSNSAAWILRLEWQHGLADAFGQNEFLSQLDIGSTFCSAWIVLDQEFVQCHPTASNTDHDR